MKPSPITTPIQRFCGQYVIIFALSFCAACRFGFNLFLGSAQFRIIKPFEIIYKKSHFKKYDFFEKCIDKPAKI